MLELKKVTKIYETDSFKQNALNEVSVCFRANEFASILGPSGSGKTTLLNIIGGLDGYSSGDLVINEISTKKFKSSNWDTYRNHRVGFVFQSYNLISHQSILANVELALTLSGISKNERKKRAVAALKEVGLKDHIHKKPNQLSGGQMQRVAIARALINNPDILLADEPTGALDSETSTQIMGLLKKIAEEKLVIMVTHNSELAEKYSTRIIKLKDGHITADSHPYDGKENTKEESETTLKKSQKKSMSLTTALSLSLDNLMTKKGRTFLTAFAGSIGIIGIALILSLSNGVNNYIERMEKETLSSYPLQIQSNTMDYAGMLNGLMPPADVTCSSTKICTTDDITNSPALKLTSAQITNNLKDFKIYLDNHAGIKDYVTDIQYAYNLNLQIYSQNTENGITKVNPNTFSLNKEFTNRINQMQNNPMNMGMANYSSDVFKELIGNNDLIESQYTILSGRLPENYRELVLVVNDNNTIPLSVIYSLNVENREDLTEIIDKTKNDKEIKLDSITYSYEDFINQKYSLLLNTDIYTKENGYWIDKSNNISYMQNKLKNGLELKIVGILKISDDAIEATSGYIGYLHDLTEYVIKENNKQDIAKAQLSSENINIFTGLKFDGIISTYKNNLKTLGIADLSEPESINIYPNGFESKEEIENIINEYNQIQKKNNKEENIITYTDMIGVLLSSVTTAVNVITYILVAFVAVSLVVSSIMIAIITYISVLERTKEIGILRAVGASKKDISRVFRAETIIEGFIAGVFGVGVTFILCFPVNKIIFHYLKVSQIAMLPLIGAVSLIIISVLLTVIAGFIPARIASKKDPVEALRTE